MADVSWVVPTTGLYTATWVPGTPAHSWQALATSGTSIGVKGMLVAAKTLSLTAIDLFRDSQTLSDAKAEYRKRVGRTSFTRRSSATGPRHWTTAGSNCFLSGCGGYHPRKFSRRQPPTKLVQVPAVRGVTGKERSNGGPGPTSEALECAIGSRRFNASQIEQRLACESLAYAFVEDGAARVCLVLPHRTGP